MPSVNERLVRARIAAGYETATDAAKAMGVGISTYLSHENGFRGLGRSAARYARFYRVSLDWLLEGRGDPKTRSLEARVAALPPAQQAEFAAFLEFLEAKSARRRTG